MGQLTNLYVSESYQGLLKLANSTTGVTGTLQYVQDGIGNNIPMLVSTSSVVITGSFRGDGSGLTGVTANADSSSLVTTSSFNAYTSSNDAKWNTLGSQSGSWITDAETGSFATTASVNALSQSIASTDLGQDNRLNSIESVTGSLQNQINQKLDTGSFNSYTSSNDAKVNALINATGSYATTSSLTSLSQSIAATDLSQDGRLNSIESKTGSYATTGSNDFVGQQNINGSVNVTGSLNVTGEITALSASITYLKTIYQTSSVIFTSGSNILGDEPSDTQTLNGAVNIPMGDLSITGITKITGGGGQVHLLGNSGSLVLGNPTSTANYSSLSHISSSNNVNVNLILKDNTASANTIVSGSGNIFTNPSNPSTGMRRYMTSYNEFLGGAVVPQISSSMTFSPTVSHNIGASQGSSVNFYGPTTAPAAWSAISNVFAGGQGINFGSNTNPMNNITGAVQITGNYLGNGTVNVKGYGSSLAGPFNIVGNTIINGLAELNPYSSSINFNANAVNGALVVNSAYTPIGGTITPALASRTNLNLLYGSNNLIQFSGSNTSTLQTKAFSFNLVQGEFITASIGSGDSSNIADTAIVGHNLIVTGSSTMANANANYGLDNTHGSAFFGRFNALDGNKAKTAETIFAVGTGTQSSRRTGFLIDSGSNVHIDGNMFVTGGLNVSNGITGSLEGTASYATNALSSSYSVNSDSSISSSYAQTASFLLGSIASASFAENANTASYIKDNILNQNLNVTGAFTASGLNYPIADNGAESFMQTDGAGNLSLKYVKTLYQNIRNMETSSIAKGTPLFVSGNTGDNANVYIADASNPARMPVTLVAGDNTLAPSATGKGIILGHIEGVDTTGYAPGTVVYVGVGGGWTSVRPTGSTVQVQELGIVTREGTNGMGIVLTVPPTTLPNTQTGYMWVGNGSNYPIQVATSSIAVASAVSSSYSDFAVSSSQAQNANLLDGKDSTEFAITGSNTFVGNQIITGSLYVSSSVANDVTVDGKVLVFSNAGAGNAPSLIVSGAYANAGTSTLNPGTILASSGSFNGIVSKLAVTHTDATGAPTTNKYIGFSANPSIIGAPSVTGTTVPSILAMNSSAQPEAVISFQHRGAYTDGRITMIKPVTFNSGSLISGSLDVSGSVIITGSVQGNVTPLTVSSNTASLNLNNGNFFELALTGSQDIRIEPSNIKPGQTVNIKLNTVGSGTVSFPSTVKQASGSAYVPTTSTGVDIITMVSFDTTNVYLANVKNLI